MNRINSKNVYSILDLFRATAARYWNISAADRFCRLLVGVIASALLCGSCEALSAEVIGEFNEISGFGFTNGPPPGFTYIVFQHGSASQPKPALRPSIFENIRVSAAVVGQEFFVGPADDADFSAVVSRLTDGIDDTVLIWHFEGPGITGSGTAFPKSESAYLGSNGHPDLIGKQITSMSLFIKSFTSDSEFDRFSFTVRAYGVPEPSTIALAVVALAVFPARRCKSVPHNRLTSADGSARLLIRPFLVAIIGPFA